MSGWMDRVSSKKDSSAKDAKDRLKLVLIHDRTNLSSQALNDLKNDLLATISKYIDIDPRSVQISMNQEGREQRLIADIPIKPTNRRKIN